MSKTLADSSAHASVRRSLFQEGVTVKLDPFATLGQDYSSDDSVDRNPSAPLKADLKEDVKLENNSQCAPSATSAAEETEDAMDGCAAQRKPKRLSASKAMRRNKQRIANQVRR